MPDQYSAFVMPMDGLQEKAYTRIAQTITDRISIVEPIYSGRDGRLEFDRLATAKKIGELVGDSKSLIIGRPHLCMTFCYPSTDAVILDYHNDSYFAWEAAYFNDGNFLLERDGKIFIIGTDVSSDHARIKTFPPSRFKEALSSDIGETIFASLEVDVFRMKDTTAHHYPHKPLLPAWLGFRDGLSFQEVLDFTPLLLNGRKLKGFNLAGYAPELDKDGSTEDY
jgi:hypothetical protein